jgi:hypothetical protein
MVQTIATGRATIKPTVFGTKRSPTARTPAYATVAEIRNIWEEAIARNSPLNNATVKAR